MREQASRVSLILFTLMLGCSLLLLSVPGEAWGWYASMIPFTIVPLILGSRHSRIIAVCALTVSLVLILRDVQNGHEFRSNILLKIDQMEIER